MRSHRNDAHNVSVNTHVRNKIHPEVYHGIVYIANEERPIRILGNFYRLFLWLFKMTNLDAISEKSTRIHPSY